MADRIENQQTPKTDAELMEPVPQGHQMPVADQGQAARPQSPAPSPAPAQDRATPPSPEPRPAASQPPAQPAAAGTQPQPDLVTITYNGRELKVTPETAEAWNHRQAGYDQGYRKVVEELDQYKGQLESVGRPTELTEEERREALATRLLTEPDRVFAEIEARLEEKLTRKYQGDVSLREFQSNWWGSNRELLPYKEMFDGLFLLKAKQYSERGLNDAQAYEETAEVLRKAIMGIRGTSAPDRSAQAAEHVEEAARAGGAPPVTEPAGEAGFMTMTAAMRAQKQRKMEADLHPASTAASPR